MGNRIITVISENRDTIKRKAIVTIGTVVGMLVASSFLDRFAKPEREVFVIEDRDEDVIIDANEIPDDTVDEV